MGGWFSAHLRSSSVPAVLHQWALLAGDVVENTNAIGLGEAVVILASVVMHLTYRAENRATGISVL